MRCTRVPRPTSPTRQHHASQKGFLQQFLSPRGTIITIQWLLFECCCLLAGLPNGPCEMGDAMRCDEMRYDEIKPQHSVRKGGTMRMAARCRLAGSGPGQVIQVQVLYCAFQALRYCSKY
jgi:hypothetical protein